MKTDSAGHSPWHVRHLALVACAGLSLLQAGCILSGMKQPPPPVPSEAALPYQISSAELVEHLNQNADLIRSWISRDCHMVIRTPHGVPVRLKATIACEEPRNFRLIADGSLVVRADVGSNENFCWWKMQPGDNALFVVPHAEMDYVRNHPLMQQTMSIPFEPEWLMQVLGVTPMDGTGMTLHRDSNPARVNLVSEHNSSDGRLYRRVTVVDLNTGRVVSHRMVDSSNHTIARAQLSDYVARNDAWLPTRIEIDWPTTKMSLTITVRNLAVNTDLQTALWEPSHDKSVPWVPLPQYLRQMEQVQQARQERPGEHPVHVSDTRQDEELPWDDEPPKRSWFRWPWSKAPR